MKEINKDKLRKYVFAAVFIFSCFTMESNNLSGYWGAQRTWFLLLRFIFIAVFLASAVLINKNQIDFISKFAKYSLWIITPIVIFDYYITNISGSIFLYRIWWIAYIIAASMAVFITVTLIKPNNYKRFYYDFWQGFTPIYFFTLIISFLRRPNNGLTTNFRLGNGTFLMLKAILSGHKSFEPYLLFFGNIIIFLPLPFILSALFKKIKPYQLALIGFAAPFIVEGYQYIFRCGDVDIDDIILNWLGYFIGMGIYLIIKKRLLEKE